ncbi:MAG: hypothetical protein LBR50_04745 [Tannerella sp.]|jgi:hypothetical protein|nr:hypothetical protein [Tannerella sp.]
METMTETVLRNKGMSILINHLGHVEAERFITLIIREPFDYTEWQRDLFDGMSVRELSRAAMNETASANTMLDTQ